jgi:hypothetical protein
VTPLAVAILAAASLVVMPPVPQASTIAGSGLQPLEITGMMHIRNRLRIRIAARI